jgi:hypothetical protein
MQVEKLENQPSYLQFQARYSLTTLKEKTIFATLLATAATQNAITILEKPFVLRQRREVLKKLTIFSFTNKS